MNSKKYYTVYLNKDDSIVASGTVVECAKQMGKSVNGFLSMCSKNNLGKQHKYTIITEILEQ